MMKINKLFTSYNFTDRNDKNRIKYVVIHYVGATGGAEANCKYYASCYVGASAHYYVGFDGEIWQSVADEDVAWSVGSSTYVHPTARNTNTLNIEMCVKKKSTKTMNATDKDWYHTKATYDATVKLTAAKMQEYNIPMENLLMHTHVTGKWCNAVFLNNNTEFNWDKFKADVKAEILGTISSTPSSPAETAETVHGMKLTEIAKYVQAEFGIASGKNYNCLLGVAQCMKDLYEASTTGKSFADTIKANFTTPSSTYSDECLQAVRDVFINGKLRFNDAKILQYRSFSKYSDGNGNPDKTKCVSLLKKYEYLGNDYINMQYGHLYFGEKITPKKEEIPAKKVTYRVGTGWSGGKCVNQTNAYGVLDNAKKEADAQAKNKKKTHYVFDEGGNKVYTALYDSGFEEYMVRVTASALNIRSGPGTNYAVVSCIKDKGAYTIIEEKNGWGRLKSKVGWISLDYTKKI